MGAPLGDTVARGADGARVGFSVATTGERVPIIGDWEGTGLGRMVGRAVLGRNDGALVGRAVEGATLGTLVGRAVDGATLGNLVGRAVDGASVGENVG